jgi:hypothetical protein
MVGRVADATPSSPQRRRTGWWHWRARNPRNWVILMNCGPPGCSPRMPASTVRPPGLSKLGKLAQGTVCKFLAEQEVKPHKMRYYLEQIE